MDWSKYGYRVTSEYGKRLDPFGSGATVDHTGIDLVKSHQAPIYAFTAGKVTHAKTGASGTGLGGFGITVVVVDEHGAAHLYAHLDSVSVSVGDVVEQGQEVGKQGTTGQSTGSHLHYEVRTKSTPSYGYGYDTDPGAYLDKIIGEDEEEMTAEEKKAFEQLQKTVEEQAKRIEELETEACLKEIPSWALEACKAAKAKKIDGQSIVDTTANGSMDFYRFVTILNRLGLLK